MIQASIDWKSGNGGWFELFTDSLDEARDSMNSYLMTRLELYRGITWKVREVPDDDIPEA